MSQLKHSICQMATLGWWLMLSLAAVSCNEDDQSGGQLAAPTTMLTANSIGIDRFGIYWSSVSGADSYEIRLDGEVLTTVQDTEYTFTGLAEATSYTAGVRALSDTAEASEWSEIRVKTYSSSQVTRLDAPTLTAPTSSVTQTGFTVAWEAVEHADYYTWTLDGGQETSTEELQVTCSQLNPATTYTIRVRAESKAGSYAASEWSEIRVRTSSEGTGAEDAPEGYRLVWSDEFDGNTLDESIWNIEVNGSGGGNNELQYYCERGVSVGAEPESGRNCLILTATRENYQNRQFTSGRINSKGKYSNNELQYYCERGVSVGAEPESGRNCLILTATRENYQNRQFTSGRINSKGKYSFTYGRLDALIRMPKTANGLWPAFWLMGDDYDQVGWPACGETDIVEMGHATGMAQGTQDRFFNGACHWGPAWNNKGDYSRDTTAPYGMQDDFHLYTCIWTEDELAMYYDLDEDPSREPYFRMTITRTAGYESNELHVGNYFHKPNFILFNLAVGGNFPGLYDPAQITALNDGPASMYVDYVRLYVKE